jgi:hypothetical protein
MREIPLLQRSVSVCCRAEAIITQAPSTLYTCETHAPYVVENSIASLPFGSADRDAVPSAREIPISQIAQFYNISPAKCDEAALPPITATI